MGLGPKSSDAAILGLLEALVDTRKPAINGRGKTGHFGERPRPVKVYRVASS